MPVWIYMPLVWEEGLCADPALRQLAEGANFTIIDLSGVFHGLPQTELRVADWDEHANARAHRLIAERLYRELHKPDVASALGVSETPTRRSH